MSPGENMQFETIKVETRGRVGIITLDRPQALTALNTPLLEDVVAAATAFDADADIGALVLTGSERAFAAGADIKEMRGRTAAQNLEEQWMSGWDAFAALETPTVAAVAGLALGGGCELAMMCDILIAADTAQFGQPEITLGLIPGLGGTQRLTRAIGKAKAMDLVLTGRRMGAEEAARAGLVARVVPAAELMDTAIAAATTIASYSAPVVRTAKRLVAQAFEVPLAEGLQAERAQFYAIFDLDDATEGIAAFAEKRPPEFRNR
ncbi:MAG: enoyl-CoA hydratase [Microbacteriaceae bacterium]|nr:enoyl-CoA hydratase [Microbacteriaceae bacterium]